MNDAQTFIEALWPTKPAAAAYQLWHKDSKKTHTFEAAHAAADWALAHAEQTDIYIAAGLAPKSGSPQRRRATIQGVIGIPGLWADIDVNGGPNDVKGRAPTIDAATELARSVLEPTVIVHSGYGLQAWWLLEEPWIFGLEAERDQAMRLSAGFQAMLKQRAKDAGYGIDSTHDLARLMRLPGTLNHKAQPAVPVQLIEDDGPRYTIQTLTELAESFIVAAMNNNGGPSVDISDELGAPPYEQIDQLRDIDLEFRATWDRSTSGKRASWGPSEYDMSIANHLVAAGFTDQEIANSIAYHRKRHDGDVKGKGTRPDYLRLTIGKARASAASREVAEKREARQEEIIENLTAIADGEQPTSPSATVAMFSELVGGPEIKELIQEGRDPSTARYILAFADGQELAIGGPKELLSIDRVREAMMAKMQHLPARLKNDRWDKVVRGLLTAVQLREDDDSSVEGMTTSWLEQYLERRLSTDKDGACRSMDPFEQNGIVYVPKDPFAVWLRKVRGQRVDDVDVKQLLQRVGLERKTVAYRREDGTRSSRSYYAGSRDSVFRAVEEVSV